MNLGTTYLKIKLKFIKIILKKYYLKNYLNKYLPKVFEEEINKTGLRTKIFYFNHHYSHACSAYYAINIKWTYFNNG